MLRSNDHRLRFLQSLNLLNLNYSLQGAVAKKPYNPILGETFHCSWDITDCCSDGLEREAVNHYHTSPAKEDGPGTIRFVAEQLSHHPPSE